LENTSIHHPKANELDNLLEAFKKVFDKEVRAKQEA
jgi:hypothetical protein